MNLSMSVAGPSRLSGGYGIEREVEDDILEEDECQLARCYFDTKEFDRVVHTLKHAQGSRAVFLRIYSSYLVSYPTHSLVPKRS
jgi:anaphase-promoting complex subunit 8